MATANKNILNKMVAHEIDVLGYGNSLSKKIIGILNKSDEAIFTKLVKVVDALPDGTVNVRKLDKLIEPIVKINNEAYKKARIELERNMAGFTEQEIDFQVKVINQESAAKIKTIAPEQVYAAALAQPFQGQILSEYFSKLSEQKVSMINNAVRMGLIEGEPTNAIVKVIRGTRQLDYKDGMLAITRRNAEAVVLTSLAHFQNFAQEALYDANADIIKGYRYTATLDTRTTELCASRDGKFFKIGEPKPAIPAHYRCRSRYVPVLKSFRELGLDVDEFPASTRASMDGQVPEKLTYSDWLKNQSFERQVAVLGKTRAELFRQGKLTLDKFISPTGHLYTLDELRQLNGELLDEVMPAPTGQAETWRQNTAWAKFHNDSFNLSPVFIKNAVIKYDEQLKGVTITARGGAEYNPATRTIKNPDTTDIKNKGTWRHEYGHFIDNVLSGTRFGFRSSAKDFDDILKSETAIVLEKAGYGRKSKARDEFNAQRKDRVLKLSQKIFDLDDIGKDAYLVNKAKQLNIDLDGLNKFFDEETIFIASEAQTKYRKALMLEALEKQDAVLFMTSLDGDVLERSQVYRKGNVGKFSDLVGSASRNKLLGHGVYGNGGHSNSYYRQNRENANTEVFANLTALYGSDNEFWHKVVDTFYPETGKLYRKILNE